MNAPAAAALTIERRTSSVPGETASGSTAAEAPTRPAVLEPVARAAPQRNETRRQPAPFAEPPQSGKRIHVRRWLLAIAKRLATLSIALVAVLMALVTWDYYVTAPWTRDGRVRVQVASVAPQVSGQITELRVGDNQYVHKGDILYVIDPFDFEVALGVAKARLQQSAADLQVKQVESERRQKLSNLATTPEQQQVFAGAGCAAASGTGGNQSAPNPGP
jgi:Biotin-lipoyl like